MYRSAGLAFVFIVPALAAWEPEVTMDIRELLCHWGYPVETYEVETSDGYLLELFRIPHERIEKHDNSTTCRPAMLFVHGFMADGSQFLLNPPETSPGYVFADAGFDIFIANVRGTAYGKSHRSLRTASRKFWEFSLDEHTNIDLPAIIDKALLISGQKSLIYVGHSQGSILGLSMLSAHEQYNKKVRALFLWGSESTAGNSRGLLGLAIRYGRSLMPIGEALIGLMGSIELIPSWSKIFAYMGTICVPEHMHDICRGIMGLMFGPSTAPFNMTRLPVYLAHFPTGSSTKNFIHHAQNTMTNDENRQYDYKFWNVLRYGKTFPPTYNYSLVDAPVHFYWSHNDFMSPLIEIQALMKRLRPDVIKEAFEIPSYSHIDFTIALDAPEKVYLPMIDIIHRKYPGCQF